MTRDELREKAKLLPGSPGCYLMKNVRGDVIYVGKAKNLKNRVISYFNESLKGAKTKTLVEYIDDFDFMMTTNEVESFILENNLIKKHGPKYNIRLRDDKTYPYVMIDRRDPYPKLLYTRKPLRDKDHYLFGPFPEGFSLKNIMRILTKVFQLRDCSDHDFKTRTKPCLLYQMGQCTAPCVDLISQENYALDVEMVVKFFSSHKGAKEIISALKDKMQEYSENDDYEKAIIVRDALMELETYVNFSEKQKVESLESDVNLDLVGYARDEKELDIVIYNMRNSLLIGKKAFSLIIEDHENFEDVMVLALWQYYSTTDDWCDTICSELEEDNRKLLTDSLKTLGMKKAKVILPRKNLKSLHQAAMDTAIENQRIRKQNEASHYKGLENLKSLLNLKELPRILECYDIAVWQGRSPTASKIVFKDGEPDKTQYRYYHLEQRPEGNNDFAMLEEVLTRRLESGNYPDVFIVDGGVAQTNSFLKILKRAQVNIPVVGIAKSRIALQSRFSDKEIVRSEERLIIPQYADPISLAHHPELMKIVVQMRDEAHRFSRKLHHHEESKQFLKEPKGRSISAKKKA